MADLLRTDYKDDILNADVNTQRKYRMIQNEDGTVSFEDVTEYEQVGDVFGAAIINRQNSALKIITATLTAGNTSISFNDKRITTNSIFSFYTSIYNVSPSAVEVIDGKVTLTFDAQDVDMEVGVRVDG